MSTFTQQPHEEPEGNEKKPFPLRCAGISFAVGAVVMLVIALAFFHFSNKRAPAISTATPVAAPSVLPPTAGTPQRPSMPNAGLLTLATVRKGGSVERSLIRQYMADPVGYGFKGDPANRSALKNWAGHEAHLLATKTGFYDRKFGASIGVRFADQVAYVVQRDANCHLSVAVYKVTATQQGFSTSSSSPESVHPAASDISQSQFLGWPDFVQSHPLPAYEYLYTGRG